MNHNSNGESRIEILKERIIERIRQKSVKIWETANKTYKLEHRINNLIHGLEILTDDLNNLRRNKDIEETKCFREIMEMHNEILKLENEWIKHLLITGMTGTGKTNTCFHILREFKKENKPLD